MLKISRLRLSRAFTARVGPLNASRERARALALIDPRGGLGERTSGLVFTPVSIVIPIFNAPAALDACLWSVARHTTFPAQLVLVDDASSDPGVDPVLQHAAALLGAEVVRNGENMGFSETANRGMRSAQGDVVLLNSDTTVGPRWLERLLIAAYSDVQIGTVTPFSDNAGAFSAPLGGKENPLSPHLGIDGAAWLVARNGARTQLRAPTGNGFCMYIKRALLDSVGDFDVDAFPRGYGEENDLCLRASALGWQHLVDGRSLVHHEREASFGDAKAPLVDAGMRQMQQLHPSYHREVQRFLREPRVSEARARVGVALAEGERSGRPRLRVLFVFDARNGAADEELNTIMKRLGSKVECLCLLLNGGQLRLVRSGTSSIATLSTRLLGRHMSRPDFCRAFLEVFDRCAPDVVHAHSSHGYVLDALRMTRRHAIPTVISLDHPLLTCDSSGRPRSCSLQTGLQYWSEVVRTFRSADALVSGSRYLAIQWRQVCPDSAGPPVSIMPALLASKARAMSEHSGTSQIPVLVASNEDDESRRFVQNLREADRRGKLEFWFLDRLHNSVLPSSDVNASSDCGVLPRPFFVASLDASARGQEIALAEARALRVPALEAVEANVAPSHERGRPVLLSRSDAAGSISRIYQMVDDRTLYSDEAAACVYQEPSLDETQVQAYGEFYEGVIARRRTLVAGRTTTHPLGPGRWRVVVCLPPGAGPNGRCARRFTHPDLAWKLDVIFDSPERLSSHVADFMLVHEAAVDPNVIKSLFAEARSLGTAFVIDRSPVQGATATVDHLTHYADAVILQTSRRQAHLTRPNSAIALTPHLDEQAFRVGPRLEPRGPFARSATQAHIAYLAPFDNEADSFLVRQVVEALTRRSTTRCQVDVVSVTAPSALPEGFHHFRVPDPEQDYPAYASALKRLSRTWDLALVPAISESESEREHRYLELAALGVPGIYLPVSESDAIVHGKNGLVAGPTPDSWASAVTRLFANEELAQKIRAQAWTEVVGGRLLCHQARAILEWMGRTLHDRRHPS